ncbi:putative membrane protein [Xanthomonas arboricola]|nr:putative membrane protein [Xanthomonas arboricola]
MHREVVDLRVFLAALQQSHDCRKRLPHAFVRVYHRAIPAARCVLPMIEVLPLMSEGVGTQLRLRPPRALSARQFVQLFAVLAGTMWVFAGLGWWTGNAFAPVFALLHSGVVALALRQLWRSGEREEAIRVGETVVEVFPSGHAPPAFQAHPHWVRLCMERDDRVVLVSSGKQIEIGSFLGPAERVELATTLKRLLAAANGRHR